ncbi:DUF6944 family repetitive protein [Niallia sp. NCCP-28]|uniref:DUF6944 family repetitive protein n=1 Tax=Niallia sp. NCCP-28 TaxID=2934712 RepID=UPI002086EA02|nr:hypothetical protein [Niallia sp. NCCP-28]GKU83761.1 hypothetical protein NCCP28_31570 [Niallia sp. NCCP-28]
MGNYVEISSVWVQVVGTIISAVANSSFDIFTSEQGDILDLYGNVLQAAGNAIQADGQETVTFEKIGAEIQAVGNVVVAGAFICLTDKVNTTLFVKGNWLQAFGALVEAVDEYFDNSGPKQPLNILGNATQAIGNTFQAIGGLQEQKNNLEKAEFLVISGSWIQAIGSILNAIGQTQEEISENNHSKHTKGEKKKNDIFTENRFLNYYSAANIAQK